MSTSLKIFQQIPKIAAEIDAIGKDRTNQQQGFRFRGIDDVYNELHGRMAKHGVFSVPEVLDSKREERPTKSGGVMTYTIARIKYTFYADDGSSFTAIVTGEGSDSGDKSSNKSMAVAHKYALLQVFCIPTEDEKDPDFQAHEVASRQPVAKPVAAPVQKQTRENPLEALRRIAIEKGVVEEVKLYSKTAYNQPDVAKLTAQQMAEIANLILRGMIRPHGKQVSTATPSTNGDVPSEFDSLNETRIGG